jgi:hypothetical protein
VANVLNGNTFYVDTASSAGTEGSFVLKKDVQILGIIFAAHSSGDDITINDVKQLTDAVTPSAGPIKIHLHATANKESLYIDLADSPVRCPNGIWISAISLGAVATIIVRLT